MDRTFPPLPHPLTDTGEERKTGVEIEFSGVTEDQTADIVCRRFGGRITARDAHQINIADTDIGAVEIVLDTALRKASDNRLVDLGLSLGRAIIPVEIVTEPLDRAQMKQLDRLCDDLRDAGAHGTANGILLGFGVHLNIEIVSEDAPHTLRTVLAFGLLEDWLRDSMQIDHTRRILPFIEPWPRDFVIGLARDRENLTFDGVRRLYAERVNSRNHGLDLLPVFKHADERLFARHFPDHDQTKGRPAFHYRLPDSRIDEAAWSLRQEWINWCRIERLAAQAERLHQLAKAFLDHETKGSADRASWATYCAEGFGADATL